MSTSFNRLAEQINRRGIIVLISDLYDDPDQITHALEHLRFRGNEVLVFQVMDRQEIEFDFKEAVVLEDCETEEQLHVLPDSLRDEYLRAIRGHIDALREGASRNRIDFELLKTDGAARRRALRVPRAAVAVWVSGFDLAGI